MSDTKCSTCRRRWPTPSDLAAREAHIDACANPDGACDWGSDVCWGEGWCLIDCRDVFEEYTSVAQALANIGTGVLIAHLAETAADFAREVRQLACSTTSDHEHAAYWLSASFSSDAATTYDLSVQKKLTIRAR